MNKRFEENAKSVFTSISTLAPFVNTCSHTHFLTLTFARLNCPIFFYKSNSILKEEYSMPGEVHGSASSPLFG